MKPFVLQFLKPLLSLSVSPPSSTGPYNLKVDRLNPAERLYNAYRFSDYGWPELDRIIKTLFDHKSDGFFVEAGALDGEYLSNTLYLEREKRMERITDNLSKTIKKGQPVRRHDHHWLPCPQLPAGAPYGSVGASEIGYQTFERVQCFPLQTILLALGVRHVDLVSLDIEGVERDVLRSFWSSGCDVVGAPTCVEVDVWIVESVDDKI
ncbi:uncharacterized protein LOC119575668 [Penaeus monodon]|uniref:uncharacterized protein LOC119575668 n=1 Tax=Penaeus monodon TaxID=6687 RepID=UPI0018A782E6|nr:uncharacterized protein LOC119575668 [Penaeus monodon]